MNTWLIVFANGTKRLIEAEQYVVLPLDNPGNENKAVPEILFCNGDINDPQNLVVVAKFFMTNVSGIINQAGVTPISDSYQAAYGLRHIEMPSKMLVWLATGSLGSRIQIANNLSFLNPIVDEETILYQWDTSTLASGIYYARVRNIQSSTAWTAIAFEIAAAQTYPAVTGLMYKSDGTHRLTWDDTQSPLYVIQVATDDQFTNIVLSTTSIVDVKEIPGIPSGPFYARVRNNTEDTAWATIQFEVTGVSYPPVMSLAYNDQTLILSWLNTGSPSYTLQVATDDQFTNLVAELTPATNSQSVASAEPGNYWVRVRNTTADETWNTLAITVLPYAAVQGLFYDDQSRILSWSIIGPWQPTHTIEIATDVFYTNIISTATGVDSAQYELPPAVTTGTYYVRVKNEMLDDTWATLQIAVL